MPTPAEPRPGGEPRPPGRPVRRPAIVVDPEVLRRIAANMAWLLRVVRPLCGSEPESYDLDDAVAAHGELERIIQPEETTASP